MLRFRAPLFDRLIDHNPRDAEETSPFMSYDAEGLFMSIAEEVSRLLHTRSFYARWQGDDTPDEIRWSVLGYGYVDFSGVTTEATQDWDQLSDMMAETVMRFEPRFLNVHVEIGDYDPVHHGLTLDLYGDVLVDAIKKRIHFPVAMGEVEMGEDMPARSGALEEF